MVAGLTKNGYPTFEAVWMLVLDAEASMQLPMPAGLEIDARDMYFVERG